LAPQKRGPKILTNRSEALFIAQLNRERNGMQRDLDKAMLVIRVKKRLAAPDHRLCVGCGAAHNCHHVANCHQTVTSSDKKKALTTILL
jgi:hypothetical protein